jgi:predicted Fe-Mo cluster-binding NifX family protein
LSSKKEKVMKICIPTEDDRGLDSELAAHFGSARWLTIVDTTTGAASVVAAGEGNGLPPGACAQAALASSQGIDAVVCGGLGRHALAALGATAVYRAADGNVRDLVAQVQTGRLPRFAGADACAGGHGSCDEHR